MTRVLSRDEAQGLLTYDEGPSRPPIDVGTTLDRFEIQGELGRGGMGEVYAAYDPRLGREVALKLLRRSADPTAEARLLREAQAMAQLDHPNLLPIFDVGRHQHGLFIAMPRIEGQTLREWMREHRPGWSEVLRVFMAAGRGLHAAHEIELVHRDFKPSNVMIDEDGEIHVMDFGLARAAGEVVDSSDGSYPGGSSVSFSTHDETLTRSDAVVGTPPYMAPEQHVTNAVDPRSDQYSFCVALWEGVYGVRPFAAPRPELLWKVKHEQPPTSSQGHRDRRGRPVPRWLRDVMLVGLRPEPGERHASMEDLLAALGDGRRRAERRRRVLAVGAGLGVVGALAWLVPTPAVCAGAREGLAGIWDAEVSAEVSAAVIATGVPYAEDTWGSLRPVLDDYAQQWIDARVEACEAMATAESQMDLRVRCLDARRRDLEAFVGVLRNADPQVVQNAMGAALGLPGVQACGDPDPAAASMPGDPRQREQLEQLEQRLSEVRAALELGRYDSVEEPLAAIESDAAELGHEPFVVEVAFVRGSFEKESGEYGAAVQTLTQAYFDAGRLGLDPAQARIAVLLTYVDGVQLRNADAGRRWAKHAEADVERAGDDVLRAALLTHIGSIHRGQDELDEALAHYQRALEIQERILDPLHPDAIRTQGNIANVLLDQGKPAESLAIQQRVLDAREVSLGPWHPQLARSYNDIGTNLRGLGRLSEAMDSYHRALKIREHSLGPEHPLVASTSANLGVAHGAAGDYREAQQWFQRALALQERILEPTHPRLAGLYNNIANTDALLGHYEKALENYHRAAEIWEERLDPDSSSVAQCLGNISTMERLLGRYAKARESGLRALEIQREQLGPEHPLLSPILQNLGSIAQHEGDLDGALGYFEQGLAIATKVYGPNHEDVVVMLVDIGGLQGEQGDLEASRKTLERALESAEQALEPTHPRMVSVLMTLGTTRVQQGETDAGLEVLERAVTLVEGQERARPSERGRARFALAQALGRSTRGRAMAAAARTDFEQAEDDSDELIAMVDAWLEEE